MARFAAQEATGVAVQELEKLIGTALFKSGNQVVGFLLQGAADRVDAAYQPKPGQQCKGRAQITVDCIFGSFPLQRDYYYHEGKKEGHYPADAALGLEAGHAPALVRLACLAGADQASYQKAQEHLCETGGIQMSARHIQRLVQSVGSAAQKWQEREALTSLPGTQAVPIMYISADGTGVPMRKEELKGRGANNPTAVPKLAWPTGAASLLSTKKMKRAIRFAITNQPPMFPAFVPSVSLVRCCAKRPSAGAWPWPWKWCC
jgi:hypothetical protein